MERREFLKVFSGGVLLMSSSLPLAASKGTEGKTLRIGVIADSHYADIDTKGSRFYRDSLSKLQEAVECFNREDLDFIIELGDMKDVAPGNDAALTLEYLDKAERCFSSFDGPVYHVLGNHDMDCISKEEFLMHTKNSGKAEGKSYYGFTMKGVRFLVLDANYNADMSDYCRGNFNWKSAWIPPQEKEWLKKELKANRKKPVVIFSHQLLDDFSDVRPQVCVGNAAEIREIIDAHPNVLAVFQGHHHPGHYSWKNGTHYLTFQGMIENAFPEHNSYAVVEIKPDGDIIVEGYKDCPDRILPADTE